MPELIGSKHSNQMSKRWMFLLISSLARIIRAVTTLIPIKVEVDPAIKSYVKSNPGAPLIISFIVLLIFSAVSLVQGNSAFANELAIYAYYALVGGVVLQIASFVIKRSKEGEQ